MMGARVLVALAALALSVVADPGPEVRRVGIVVEEVDVDLDGDDWAAESRWKGVAVAGFLAAREFNKARSADPTVRADSLLPDLFGEEVDYAALAKCADVEIEAVLRDNGCFALDTVGLSAVVGPACVPVSASGVPTFVYEGSAVAVAASGRFSVLPEPSDLSEVLCAYFESIQHRTVMIVHENSPSGFAMRAAMEAATRRSSVRTLAASFGADDADSLELALEAVRQSGATSVLCLVDDASVEEVLLAAKGAGVLGSRFLWTFTPMTSADRLRALGPLAHGALRLSADGNMLPASAASLRRDLWDDVEEWWNGASPEALSDLVGEDGFDEDLVFDDAASAAFDSVVAAGLLLCESQHQSDADLAGALAGLHFEGTSGLVVFTPDGTRFAPSMPARVSNIVHLEPEAHGGGSAEVGDALGGTQEVRVVAAWADTEWVTDGLRTPFFGSEEGAPPADALGDAGLIEADKDFGSGYLFGDFDTPVCWETELDPQHARFDGGHPRRLAACPEGLQLDFDQDSEDLLELDAQLLEPRTLKAVLSLGSDECANALDGCTRAVGFGFDLDSDSDSEAYGYEPESAHPQPPQVDVVQCAIDVPLCTPFLATTIAVGSSTVLSEVHRNAPGFAYLVSSNVTLLQAGVVTVLLRGTVTLATGATRIDIARAARLAVRSDEDLLPATGYHTGASSSAMCWRTLQEPAHPLFLTRTLLGNCPLGVRAAFERGEGGEGGEGAQPQLHLAGTQHTARFSVEPGRGSGLEVRDVVAHFCGSSVPLCVPETATGNLPVRRLVTESGDPNVAQFETYFTFQGEGEYRVVAHATLAPEDPLTFPGDNVEIEVAAQLTIELVQVLADGGGGGGGGEGAGEGQGQEQGQGVAKTSESEGYHLGNFAQSVCWKTSMDEDSESFHVTRQLAKCPSDVRLIFAAHSPRFIPSAATGAHRSLSATLRLGSAEHQHSIGAGQHPLDEHAGHTLPHYNLHVCSSSIAFCSPLLAGQGLPASMVSSTPTQRFKESAKEPDAASQQGALVFATTTELPPALKDGRYTVLAHAQVFTDDGAWRWDIAAAHPLELGAHPTEDLSHISPGVRRGALLAAAANAMLALALLVWTRVHRKNVVVRASQQGFLSLVLVGVLAVTATVPLLALEDDPAAPTHGAAEAALAAANAGCSASLVTYAVGFVAILVPLAAKMHATAHMYEGGRTPLVRRIKVPALTVAKWLAVGLLVDLIVLTALMASDAPVFVRTEVRVDRQGLPVRSAGACRSPGGGATEAAAALLALHVLAVLAASALAFRTANLKTAYSENRYVGTAVLSSMQTLAMLPVLLVVDAQGASPTARFTLAAVLLLAPTALLQLLLFFPKLVVVHSSKHGALRHMLLIDETLEAKVSPNNSPTKVGPAQFDKFQIRPLSSDYWSSQGNNNNNGDDQPQHVPSLPPIAPETPVTQSI